MAQPVERATSRIGQSRVWSNEADVRTVPRTRAWSNHARAVSRPPEPGPRAVDLKKLADKYPNDPKRYLQRTQSSRRQDPASKATSEFLVGVCARLSNARQGNNTAATRTQCLLLKALTR